MIEMTLAEIADVVGGTAHGEATVTGGAFVDTRTPEQGGLFVAVAGERVDGHDFAREAHEAGAAAVLGSRPTEVPTVVVDDVVRALGVLARHVLDQLPDALVLAMTGSQGKTGTKDYLAHVLGEAGRDGRHPGQLQQRDRRPAHRAARHTRHPLPRRRDGGPRDRPRRAPLHDRAAHDRRGPQRRHRPHRRVRQPRGDRAGQGRARRGTAGRRHRRAQRRRPARRSRWQRARPRTVVTFGHDEGAAVAVTDVTSDDLGRLSFELVHRGAGATVHLAQVGAHQWRNAAAAAAMALTAGLDLDAVADSLGDAFPASRWRMELAERPDGLVVINDAYNANPESMEAALETLAGIGSRSGRRTLAVLGEMFELGPGPSAAHAARRGVRRSRRHRRPGHGGRRRGRDGDGRRAVRRRRRRRRGCGAHGGP